MIQMAHSPHGLRRDPIEERLLTVIEKLSEPELTACERFALLRIRIERFAADLDDRHDIFARLADFPDFRVLHIYYEEPYTIVFIGELDRGGKAKIIQHVNQVGVMLAEVPRRPGGFKREIEFGPPDGNQNE